MKSKQKTILEKAVIVFGTSSSLGQEDVRRMKFDLCICDEGGQAPDTGLVMALRDNTRTLAIIGDPRQLPPYQLNPDLKSGFGGRTHRLDKSALEDYFELDRATCLNSQYRCHPDIMEPLNKVFYGGTVSTGKPFNRAEEELFEKNSLYNKIKAKWVSEKLFRISCHLKGLDRPDRLWSLMVISPYQGQVNDLRKFLCANKDRWSDQLNVTVCNADSCQGGECDVAIISLVRHNSQGNVGFLTSPKRVLTMLSRAKEYIMIATHVKTFSSELMWNHLFGTMRQNNALEVEDDRKFA
ncbi:AAA domain [Phytophthora infestans]|uniref:AAA domain n=1 Tax=Phytophthora infestans TaxID=4787 RepID=A0A8S9UT15_PHYIN|nr:AAA domain [Phytophthora infestans]